MSISRCLGLGLRVNGFPIPSISYPPSMVSLLDISPRSNPTKVPTPLKPSSGPITTSSKIRPRYRVFTNPPLIHEPHPSCLDSPNELVGRQPRSKCHQQPDEKIRTETRSGTPILSLVHVGGRKFVGRKITLSVYVFVKVSCSTPFRSISLRVPGMSPCLFPVGGRGRSLQSLPKDFLCRVLDLELPTFP